MNVFDQHKTEVKECWGDTAAYGEYVEKTKDYSDDKWDSLAVSMDDIMARFAVCMNAGNASDSDPAQNLVKTLQNHITANYYHCTDQILFGLGQMYVGDERFKSNIDRHGDGTAAFVCEAITAYCHTI